MLEQHDIELKLGNYERLIGRTGRLLRAMERAVEARFGYRPIWDPMKDDFYFRKSERRKRRHVRRTSSSEI